MFKIFGCLILLIILLPLLFVGGIALRIWNFLHGNSNRTDNQQSTNKTTTSKIFRKDEGEYVDFEEVE